MRSKKAIVNIITSLLLQIMTIVCGLVIPKLIIQNFGSGTNGLISSITQFLGYIALLESGVGPIVKAALYKPIEQRNKLKISEVLNSSERFFRKIAYIFVIYIIILCFVFPIIMKEQFDIYFTLSLVVIIAVSTFSEYFFGMTYRLYLESEQKTYIVSVIQLVTYVINTAVVVLLIKLKCSIQIVKLSSAIIYVLRPMLINFYVKKKYDIHISKEKSVTKLKQQWDGVAQHIAAVVHNNTDITILTLFSTAKQISVYSVHWLILNGVKNVILAFASGMDASFGSMIVNEETEHLRKSFKIYELFYFTIVTIVFASTMLLIVPFIKVYTAGITDTNYIVPAFAILLTISEFVWSIRQPYNELVKAAGHFRETRIGAWLEAIINIVLSIILVKKYGMIGIAIGTLVAMIFRTAEFIIHTSKHILKRNISIGIRRILVTIVQVLLIAGVVTCLPSFNNISYMGWIIYAIEVVSIAALVVVLSNALIYLKDGKELFKILKKSIKK